MKTVYPSFPMSHVMDLPDTLARNRRLPRQIAEKMIAFDPGDVDEKVLSDLAIRAATEGKASITVTVNGAPMSLKVADLLQIVPDIDGQIYARDFMLVRQSDMIVSYIPELPGPAGTRQTRPLQRRRTRTPTRPRTRQRRLRHLETQKRTQPLRHPNRQ